MSTSQSLIYPDTNIWNQLSKQNENPAKVLETLSAKGATLVLSPHTIYELARTFTGSKPTSVEQAVKLFSYIKVFLDAGIPCSKQLMNLVGDEAVAFHEGRTNIDPLLSDDDRQILCDEVTKLASGNLEQRVPEFIQKRQAFAADTREAQKNHFEGREKLKEYLLTIPEANLAAWLPVETTTASGIAIISSHLGRISGATPPPDFSLPFLQSPVSVASKGVVRADLYYNWRSANRGSNPPDLMDDMLHVLQAIYCHFYVTEEPKQSQYASLLLTCATHLAIYDRNSPVGTWLEGLLEKTAKRK
jgi:hypothetical protein